MPEKILYCGDPGAPGLRRHVKDESVDLVYLDLPFQSNQDYPGAPGLFAERDGTRAAAQIKAVGWAESSSPTIGRSRFNEWWDSKTRPTLPRDRAAAEAFHEVVEAGGRVAGAMIAFRTFLGENPGAPALAYLANIAPRLVELRRVLKPTGSIYLHCNPRAS